jgi:predicted AlkP superfamily pyrophosphatase or phosphodiesterase
MTHTWLRVASCLLAFALAAAPAAAQTLTPFDALPDDDDRRGRSRGPQVVVISLDGAQPDVIERYLKTGVLDKKRGLGRLARHGVVAEQNITATPSVTAVSHIAIATGSTAPHNNIPANTFHPVAAPIGTSISGFAAPIGGYRISPLGPSPAPTAEPLWVQLRRAGKEVVTATWPGSDGADIRITGTLVQAATPTRITDYTVPFGAFGGLGAQGFTTLTAASFVAADASLVAQLTAGGHVSFSEARVTASPVETVFCAPTTTATCGTTNASGRTLRYDIKAVAIDTTNDRLVNYDTLVFFESGAGIPPGPFALPATGPAYVKAGGRSDTFFFAGSGNKIGTAFFVSHLAPDLSSVRFARYAANFIPRNEPVLAAVDDINENVGFWAPQPDFRIPERLSPGFGAFPDEELEAMYLDQVRTFTDYQTRVALRAMEQSPDADLVMIYLEQPDGSGHQFTLTDRRQPTNPLDARTVGSSGNPPGAIGQDPAKVTRYASYLRFGYQQADVAVERILDAVGPRGDGKPRRDVFVVSDHGMAPFHTAVMLSNLLAAAGIDLSEIGIRTTGPAANIYVNLQGREPGGTVTPADYPALVARIATALRGAVDPNAFYNPGKTRLFSHVWTRPDGCGRPGFCTDENIGQDTGDVLALMIEGYNFDGTQSPVVRRLGDDTAAATPVYSVPNFYGAHGHDSALPSMSAILYAAGPSIAPRRKLGTVQNIDIAPTVLQILGVPPAPTVDGEAIRRILRDHGHGDD